VNTEVTIPIPSVTEKPLIGPDPSTNKIKAAINVVTLASIIEVSAFS
jgi:hypothetical protein